MMAIIQAGCDQGQSELQSFEQIVLLDVQGLFGGQDLWIAADGSAFCRSVSMPEAGQSGLQETQYEFKLSEQQRRSLLALFEKHNFFSIQINNRYGIPDEARPAIFTVSGSREYAISKWANDRHKDFDPIYSRLRALVSSAKEISPVYQGVYRKEWRPKGFPEREIIMTLADQAL